MTHNEVSQRNSVSNDELQHAEYQNEVSDDDFPPIVEMVDGYKSLFAEVNILQELSHPNIIKLYSVTYYFINVFLSSFISFKL